MKIDKEFLLSDSSVNSLGYRFLTSGLLLDNFAKNPVGYYNDDRQAGILVKWVDIRKDGDRLYAKPFINRNHPQASKVIHDIQNGFLSSAQFGDFIIEDVSNGASLMLPGQTGETVTKWWARSCNLISEKGFANIHLADLSDKNGLGLNVSQRGFKNMLSAANKGQQFQDALRKAGFEVQFSGGNNGQQLSGLKGDPNSSSFKAVNEPTISVDELRKKLYAAYKAKDITEGQMTAMAIEWQNDLTKAPKVIGEYLRTFRQQRVEALMGLSYTELNKNNLLVELADKFYEGFQIKYILQFGKSYDSKRKASSKTSAIISAMEEYAVEVGAVSENMIQLWDKGANFDSSQAYIDRLQTVIINNSKNFIGANWEELEKAGRLEQLKQRNIKLYKQMFKEAFGTEYKS